MGVDALRDAIDAAIDGRGSLVFVTGEPGMGKTTAAQDVAAAATTAGALVLWAACWQDDATAHAPWRSLLTELDEQGAAALAVLTRHGAAGPTSAAAARAGAYGRDAARVRLVTRTHRATSPGGPRTRHHRAVRSSTDDLQPVVAQLGSAGPPTRSALASGSVIPHSIIP